MILAGIVGGALATAVVAYLWYRWRSVFTVADLEPLENGRHD